MVLGEVRQLTCEDVIVTRVLLGLSIRRTRRVCPIRINLIDCDQWNSQVADSAQHTVQRRLVDDPAVKSCRAVAFMPELEAVEGSSPSDVKMHTQPNFVLPSSVQSHAPKVDSDVMRRPHHM